MLIRRSEVEHLLRKVSAKIALSRDHLVSVTAYFNGDKKEIGQAGTSGHDELHRHVLYNIM